MPPLHLPSPLAWPERSSFIRRAAWGLAGAVAVGLGLALLSTTLPPWLWVSTLVCLAGFLGVPLVLARGRSSWTAGLLLLGCLGATIVLAAAAQGGPDAPFLAVLPFLPVAGFVLLDSRAAWLLAGWIGVLLAALVLLDRGLPPWLPPPESPSPSWAPAAWLIVTCLLIALVAALYERRMAKVSRELHIHATRDHLTGLVNRRHFDEVLEDECRRAARSRRPLALILLDIDHFKSFNDTYGHPHGDLCLIAVAYAITTCMHRAGDLAARYGGEEFVALFPGATEAQAARIAETIRAAVGKMSIPHTGSPRGVLTLSLGVAAAVEAEEFEPDRLLQAVDHALYRAKQEGRDRVVGASATAAPS